MLLPTNQENFFIGDGLEAVLFSMPEGQGDMGRPALRAGGIAVLRRGNARPKRKNALSKHSQCFIGNVWGCERLLVTTKYHCLGLSRCAVCWHLSGCSSRMLEHWA